ncbi:MAG: hypothetical protein U0R80_08020 [Nocardioidaceae bacterium]
MPGRTPVEAFEAFIEPIQRATSCLGAAKIVPSAGGRAEPGRPHAWSLNGLNGMTFPGGWQFEAQMHYEIVQRPISREWKIATLGYRYHLALQGNPLWRLHWHPTVTSSYHLPHLHWNVPGLAGGAPVANMGDHFPVGRMTYEDAIEWVVTMVGCTPTRTDWRDVLSDSRDLHRRHRTWSTVPPHVGPPGA